jgi:hypothetical protein
MITFLSDLLMLLLVLSIGVAIQFESVRKLITVAVCTAFVLGVFALGILSLMAGNPDMTLMGWVLIGFSLGAFSVMKSRHELTNNGKVTLEEQLRRERWEA